MRDEEVGAAVVDAVNNEETGAAAEEEEGNSLCSTAPFAVAPPFDSLCAAGGAMGEFDAEGAAELGADAVGTDAPATGAGGTLSVNFWLKIGWAVVRWMELLNFL